MRFLFLCSLLDLLLDLVAQLGSLVHAKECSSKPRVLASFEFHQLLERVLWLTALLWLVEAVTCLLALCTVALVVGFSFPAEETHG